MLYFRQDHPVWLLIAEQLDDAVSDISWLSQGANTQNYKMTCASTQYFVKFCPDFDVLAAEKDGLTALANAESIKVPTPVLLDSTDSTAVLVSEYIELNFRNTNYLEFGERLCAMHSQSGKAYGWHRNNYIGKSSQINTWCDNWCDFFLNHRLLYQLEKAWADGYGDKFRSLGELIPDAAIRILADHQPRASLLHGDLWRGNYGFYGHGKPVILDPAVYFGDRETDLAMIRLFGSPPESLFAAYFKSSPPDEGIERRKLVYDLYHILNHLNIFGHTYRWQAENLMREILYQAS